MRATAMLFVVVALALAAAAPTAIGAAWDPAPIDLTPGIDDGLSGPIDVQVATTADGAVWTSWFERAPANAGSYVVRRVATDGTVGERRVLAGGDVNNGSATDVLAVHGPDSVRLAYLLGPGFGSQLALRTLTPTVTGDAVVLYDAAATTPNGGHVDPPSVRVLPGLDGATWVQWLRGDTGFVLEARLVDSADHAGTVAELGNSSLADGAVDDQGRLISVLRQGGPGRVVVIPVGTDADATVGSATEIQPTGGAGTIAEDIRVVITGATATIAWIQNATGRHLLARRVTTSTMAAQGAGSTALDDSVPTGYQQQAPILASDAAGDAMVAWIETDSSDADTVARRLAAGDLSSPGIVGDRIVLDGPPPARNWPSGVMSSGAGTFTVLRWGDTAGCRALTVSAIDAVSSDVGLGPACSFPSGPSDASSGLAAAWYTNAPYKVQVTRYVTTPPVCADDAPATVEHGASVTLALSCSGWRPVPEIVGAPALGTLGAIDLAAKTVAYTATAATGGPDVVSYRASNAAGPGPLASAALTVHAPTPSPPPIVDTTDVTAPVVTKLSLSPRRLARSRARALKLHLSLSEAARVTVTVERIRPAKRHHKRRVTRVRQLVANLPAGDRAILILAAKRAHTLALGGYRVTIAAVDAAGNKGKPVTVRFAVRRR